MDSKSYEGEKINLVVKKKQDIQNKNFMSSPID
jgi:hypothetical protein